MNGVDVEFEDDGSSLLDVLRDLFGCRSVKDGCSPQGQCGCCTVWVDGAPRVACVTPARRVAGRSVTTVEGMDPALRSRWVDAFADQGASQCGFCTPGILMRLAALSGQPAKSDGDSVRTALLAHLCRCTGWQSIVDAAGRALGPDAAGARAEAARRDPLLASWRAQVEGPVFQSSGPSVVLGNGGFASDTAPPGALVAIRDDAAVSVADDLRSARRGLPKVQGRRSGVPLRHPVRVPEGTWTLTLQTTWVEPAYLEPDASWCLPGGVPSSPLANGGAFGGKRHSAVAAEARALADAHQRPVLALWTREEVVRRGPKRPPVAIGILADGTGVMRVARPAGSDLGPYRSAVAAAAPGLVVEWCPVAGPPVAPELRAAGWAEATVVTAVLRALAAGTVGHGVPVEVTSRSGGRARVVIDEDERVAVDVWAGEVLDETTLRSYCFGAVHQALGWVRSEGVAVDDAGRVQDLTVRSFGVLPARDTPAITVTVHPSDLLPVNGSDAVFAAAAAAAWLADDLVSRWPTRRGER
ncbi:MAG TPA: 2Fe-2S iron-sulfur cluster-binding protein [Acidimicrobiales bacterium]|nr:2Fe-2S iron-sulfur cluster-binding protein [Acidimicrobiales bacterium]